MSEPSLLHRQRTLLRQLVQIAEERRRVEPELAEQFHVETERANQQWQEARTQLARRTARERERLDQELAQKTQAIEARYTAELDQAQKEFAKARYELTSELEAAQQAALAAFQEANWAADAVLEAAKAEAESHFRNELARVSDLHQQAAEWQQQAHAQLRRWKQDPDRLDQLADKQPPSEKLPRKLGECLDLAQEQLDVLIHLTLPRYAWGLRLPGLLVLAWLVLLLPLGWLIARIVRSEADLLALVVLGLIASTVVTGIGSILIYPLIRSLAGKAIEEAYLPLRQLFRHIERVEKHLQTRYQADRDEAIRQALLAHQQALEKAHSQRTTRLADISFRKNVGLSDLDRRLAEQLQASEQRRHDDLTAATTLHQQSLAEVEQHDQTKGKQLDDRHDRQLADIRQRLQTAWRDFVERWQKDLSDALSNAADINRQCQALFPPWDDPTWDNWQPATTSPPLIRFGSYTVQTSEILSAAPWIEPRPEPAAIRLTLPACCALPEHTSLMLHARDQGRELATQTLQTLLFRLLTTVPPGRIRFLIVDPVGLGQNFAAFMNLADHDESLVGSRIWTEAAHIEQRLADLTAHMENVIQKYLRNRYATISEYNAEAGEVAEPYRVLVVANFPTNFTAEAVRRLLSIVQSGPRCGVTTLVSLDRRQELPRGFDLADLERHGVHLDWADGRFQFRDPDFAPYPLSLDAPPADDFCNRILQRVGEAARNAQRVEVPFEFIAPSADLWWKGNATRGLSVPLGRAGATRRQYLELGKGTAQHALVAGKTGSGKSTLLHALITNLALLYSPDEVELYLIDFKKGVEFKTYAVHELPHARVIAIESEREFGLSVLQRLDTELKQRGERFRVVNAQDLAAYRQARPDVSMPRVLLIVDEFQEFFTEDDRIAQEAARLLDRLVRQGRAFGLHVLLGSQTLGGAYSLARSTIDQMAVRIALQCSEADAHLILSDDNSAARLLSRPGEAIYNDQNGLVEGNDPFQVVWLDDAKREQYLLKIAELARSTSFSQAAKEQADGSSQPTISHRATALVVFEGNASADITRNRPLAALLAHPEAPVQSEGQTAWLGEAMAIDELTGATFHRRNGSNLLLVGQQPESVLGMLSTAIISLAAANGFPAAPRLFFIDGHQGETPRTGILAQLADLLPGTLRLAGSRGLGAMLLDLCSELERRQQSPEAEAPPLYLFLYGLHRLRDLRRNEDDFGSYLGRADDKPPTPDKQLGLLLREGPSLGIHCLIWCDTLTNLQRSFDRQTLRELALRVVFQMNVADSSNLIDSPAAAKLGMYRALYCSEEEGKMEKFRPYGIPPQEWLASLPLARRKEKVI
jgi:S-DNA-T family DNA segregation ATPase FtsK/SpoIIIE